MKDKTVVITGATSGIGKSTAVKLASFGCEVVVLARNLAKAKEVKNEILKGYPDGQIKLIEADLKSLKSVQNASEEIQRQYPKIDILINNAGGVFEKYEETEDGLAVGFQVNHLAHFLLTQNLLPLLLKSQNARVINLSSEAHKIGKIDWENLMGQKKYSTWKQYGSEKLMNILFTKELTKRYANQGLFAFAVHPGVVRTAFASNNTGWLRFFNKLPFIISPEKGSETTVYCATQHLEKLKNGGYYKKSSLSGSSSDSLNEQNASKLWEVSEQILKEKL